MLFTTRGAAIKQTGLSYLGGVNLSSKMLKNLKVMNTDTYIIYLAPAKTSGYNMCPASSKACEIACLNESGHNRIDIKGKINKSRIKKTIMYVKERNFFTQWVVAEITAAKALSELKGHNFAVRINGTSDINIETLKLGNKNILQLFPTVQFYDYTKVVSNIKLQFKYPNYNITFSFAGDNWLNCEHAIVKGLNVAVVFEKIPAFYMGIPVINADETDLRFMDPSQIICGLKHKKTRTKIDYQTSTFIVPQHNKNCAY